MTSTIKVDNIQKVSDASSIIKKCGSTTTVGSGAGNTVVVCGATVTIGRCGGSVALASGATQTGFGRTGTVDWDTSNVKTGDFTAVSGNGYFINTTSGEVTVTLPAGSAGSILSFADYAGTWNDNKVTLSPNGSDKIGGNSQVAEMETEGQSATFVFVDSTQGWVNTMDSTSNVRGKPEYIVATGGTITTVDTNYKVHKFTGPGTFEVTNIGVGVPADQKKVDYMVVAGGGGAGYHYGGGGGAGGFRESKTAAVSGCWTASPIVSACGSLTVTETSYPIVVGGGGSSSPSGGPYTSKLGCNGNTSSFSTISSAGGGGGNGTNSGAQNGGPGGSGGAAGGTGSGGTGGTGNTPPVSPPQGNNGAGGTAANAGGGGGGATAAGSGKIAGAGSAPTITGSPVGYAGGGNGGPGTCAAPTGGSQYGVAGAANTGAGAGGDAAGSNQGGSGIVIIRYKFQ